MVHQSLRNASPEVVEQQAQSTHEAIVTNRLECVVIGAIALICTSAAASEFYATTQHGENFRDWGYIIGSAFLIGAWESSKGAVRHFRNSRQ